jgi:hypothetical protein
MASIDRDDSIARETTARDARRCGRARRRARAKARRGDG